MTYPEGRQPLEWADLTPKHSTWEAEAKALREQNTELALQVLAAEGQAEEAYKAQQQAESAASWADIKANQAINEAKALRARVQELEQTVDGIWRYAVDTTVSDHHFRGWAEVEARAALQKQEGE